MIAILRDSQRHVRGKSLSMYMLSLYGLSLLQWLRLIRSPLDYQRTPIVSASTKGENMPSVTAADGPVAVTGAEVLDAQELSTNRHDFR